MRGAPLTPPDTKPFTLRLPPDLYEQLRKIAFDQHVSMNALIIAAIQAQLET
jgi:predicted HicB family RNase H-like nuclease